MFPAFTKDVESTRKILDNFPTAIRIALGISLKNFFSIYGFFAYIFSFASLAGAVQAMNLGVGVISKEFSNKTADFLLTKPISRLGIITSKIAAAICVIIFTNLIFSLVTLAMARIVMNGNGFNTLILLLISGSMLLIQLFFVIFGILLSLIIPRVKSIVAVSLPVVFIFYIIGTLGSILGNENVKYLSPFKFFDPIYIINNVSYEPKFLIIEAVILVVVMIASCIIFIKKDIHAAS
jgi:ABC-2 type transport system permease protein